MNLKVSEPIPVFSDSSIYASFPDIIYHDNKFVVVFRVGDAHHPEESLLMLAESSDGNIWKSSEFAKASLSDKGYVFNCPRLNLVNGKLVIVCDTKDSIKEGDATWNIISWWKMNDWIEHPMCIDGAVPDKIISVKKRLLMGYHRPEKVTMVTDGITIKRFSQMVAESHDGGNTWSDRTTIAVSHKNYHCEGSIVKLTDDKLLCFMRDNKSNTLRSRLSASKDGGRTWGESIPLDFAGHRIVANVKQYDPYAGVIIGTFRNTVNRNVSLFILNPKNNKYQVLPIDIETHPNMFNYGYSGWVEKEDGTLQIVYYIQRNKSNPEIVSVTGRLY